MLAGMTELITFGETPIRVSPPDARRLETAGEAELAASGTESNVAIAAACLEADCTWISKLPDAPPGRRVVRELEQHGIETAIEWADEGDARLGVVYHEDAATPRVPGTWHDRDLTTAATMTPGDVPMELVQHAEVIFTGATVPALSDAAFETAEALHRAGGGAGATTALDLDLQPGHRSADELREAVLRLTEHLDVMFANEETARAVFDRKGKPRELANGIVAEHGLSMAVITRSEHGAVVLHDTPGTNVVHERSGVETEVVDEAGQHEALVGGFLERLLAGADAAEALSYGVAMASLARTVPGPLLTVDSTQVASVVDDVVAASR
jgi:2-dehydro-3-deoxygluconokinase